MKTVVPPSLWPAVHRLAAREEWPPSSKTAADRLVAHAAPEGLLPLLFAEPEPPPVLAAALERNRAWHRLYARRAEILLEATRALCDLLRDEPFVLLKGSDYRHRLYPRPELRPMQDIDLLVPRDRFAAACRRLEEAGLRPGFPGGASTRVPSYPERSFLLGEVVVEVHHSFVQRIRHRIDYDAVWERRQPLEAGAFRAQRLSDEDALAYHALSLAKDEFSVPLVRYVDLWLMVRDRQELVERAAHRAREWHATRALYGTFRQASRLFPEMRTENLEAVAADLVTGPGRRFLDRWVLPAPEERGKTGRAWRARQLWRKLWLIDDPWRRGAFALHHGYASLMGRWLGWRAP